MKYLYVLRMGLNVAIASLPPPGCVDSTQNTRQLLDLMKRIIPGLEWYRLRDPYINRLLNDSRPPSPNRRFLLSIPYYFPLYTAW